MCIPISDFKSHTFCVPPQQIKDIQHQAEKWERDSRNARHGGERLVEESNMFKFKNQLLIEMVRP